MNTLCCYRIEKQRHRLGTTRCTNVLTHCVTQRLLRYIKYRLVFSIRVQDAFLSKSSKIQKSDPYSKFVCSHEEIM